MLWQTNNPDMWVIWLSLILITWIDQWLYLMYMLSFYIWCQQEAAVKMSESWKYGWAQFYRLLIFTLISAWVNCFVDPLTNWPCRTGPYCSTHLHTTRTESTDFLFFVAASTYYLFLHVSVCKLNFKSKYPLSYAFHLGRVEIDSIHVYIENTIYKIVFCAWSIMSFAWLYKPEGTNTNLGCIY